MRLALQAERPCRSALALAHAGMQQQLGGCRGADQSLAQLLPIAIHLQRMHIRKFGLLFAQITHLKACLMHIHHQAKLQRADARRHLRDAGFVELPDTCPPLRHRALMTPVLQRIPRALHIRDAAQESRHDEPLIRQRYGDEIPKLPQRLWLLRPQGDRLRGLDLPLRLQAHHVLVENLARQRDALIALLHLREVVLLIRGERASELLGDEVFKVFLRRMRSWQRATCLTALHRHERGAQRQIIQRLVTHIALTQPATRRLQPAHVRPLLVQLHLRHHFVFEEVDAFHRIIIDEPLRLLAQA